MANERACYPVSRAELERRWKAVRSAMQDEGLQALVVQGANNLTGIGGHFRWLTGISVASSYPQTVIFPLDGHMILVTHGAFDGRVKLDDRNPAMPGVGLQLTNPAFPAVEYCGELDADLVVQAVNEAGYDKIGLVARSSMYYGFASSILTRLRQVQFSDATPLVDALKALKSIEEIELIRRTAAMQDDILNNVAVHIRPGMRDFEVMAYGQYLAQSMGSETGYFLGSSAPWGAPAAVRRRAEQNRVMEKGDVFYVQCEVSGPGGEFVHAGRPFVLGKAPQELVDVFGAMVEAQDYTVKLLTLGAECSEIANAYNDYMRSRGFPEETRLHCHGQGYDVVERPLIRRDERMKIGAGMNIGIHPAVGNDRFFVMVCDNFLTHQNNSVERLHKTPRSVVELETA